MQRGPKAIGDVVSELIARRGFGRVQSATAYDAAWREAAGPLTARFTRPGALRGGTLEIIVAHSVLVQELGFQRQSLLKNLAGLLPGQGITNLRFRVGKIE